MIFVRRFFRKSLRFSVRYHGMALFYLYIMGITEPAWGSCLPPVPPPVTSEAAARAFSQEFSMEFEAYFRDAQGWFICVEQQQQVVKEEVNNTAQRYQRFILDKEKW